MRVIEALEPEVVQDYPRPPALERVALRLRVVLGGETVADSTQGWRVCETHHAPTYYIPAEDVTRGALTPAQGSSFCEWKGRAAYWDVTAGGLTRPRAAWSYPSPTGGFARIAGHLAFYSGQMDECWVGETWVTPQPGDFYGGWVTPNLEGTVKGGPGTRWW
jgi:uncharacterized protein (DUF427 family)